MAQAQYRPVRSAVPPQQAAAAAPPSMAVSTHFARDLTWYEHLSDALVQADTHGQAFALQHPYVYLALMAGTALLLLAVVRRIYALRML
jgi:hypothetical protein